MAKLDKKAIEELIEQAKQKQLASGVKVLTYGDTNVYSGADGVVYTTWGEAHASLQSKTEVETFKKQGLNSQGQTPKQEAQARRRAEKFKLKEALLKQLAGVDEEIAEIGREDKKDSKKDKK